MKSITFTILLLVLFTISIYLTFFGTYGKKYTYTIVDKFSVSTGDGFEYYFKLKQRESKIIVVSVKKEIYDYYDLYEEIVIF